LTVVTTLTNAARIGCADERSDTDTSREIAFSLVRRGSSIKRSAVSVGGTGQAATVSLAIVSGGAGTVDIVSARTTYSRCSITDNLVRDFTSIERSAVSVGSAGKAGKIFLTISATLANTAGVGSARERINANTSSSVTLCLCFLLSTI